VLTNRKRYHLACRGMRGQGMPHLRVATAGQPISTSSTALSEIGPPRVKMCSPAGRARSQGNGPRVMNSCLAESDGPQHTCTTRRFNSYGAHGGRPKDWQQASTATCRLLGGIHAVSARGVAT
jgi:hypothetical protein